VLSRGARGAAAAVLLARKVRGFGRVSHRLTQTHSLTRQRWVFAFSFLLPLITTGLTVVSVVFVLITGAWRATHKLYHRHYAHWQKRAAQRRYFDYVNALRPLRLPHYVVMQIVDLAEPDVDATESEKLSLIDCQRVK